VKLACERHKRDLARVGTASFPYEFNPVLERNGTPYRPADLVCRFIESLPHIKGDYAGTLFALEPWQCFIICVVFGWVGARGTAREGLRRFRRVYVEVPRGNGKSALCAPLALYMLVADGEAGAEVYSVATAREQARIVFDQSLAMVRASPALARRYDIGYTLTNVYSITRSANYRPLSADAHTLDGLNVHFGVVDELHAHKHRHVYDVTETAIGKRMQSLLWIITTAGKDRQGICFEVRSYITKVLLGLVDDDAQFGAIWGIDEGDDWTTEEALVKANPNYGVSVKPEILRSLQQKAKSVPSAAINFRTKHLNEWVTATGAWADIAKWESCKSKEPIRHEDLAGRPCYVGLDLAAKTDFCELSIVFPPLPGADRGPDAKWFMFTEHYLPFATVHNPQNMAYAQWERMGWIKTYGATIEDSVIDFDMIERRVIELCDLHAVQEIGFDRWQATQLATRLTALGLPMVEVRPIVANFSSPMKELEALMLQQRLVHSGDPVLTWMIGNVIAKEDFKGNIFPRKERNEDKIDGVVAIIMAMARALVHIVDDDGDFNEFISGPIATTG
jgi:phage terminase large subunit-like protein